MHNAPLLMRGEREQRALTHVNDAEALGIAAGDTVRVSSPHGHIELAVELTADIMAGGVANPHGWGIGASATCGWPTGPGEPTSTS
jgi:anaerobic selenocysteine-containing dehydrogenase